MVACNAVACIFFACIVVAFIAVVGSAASHFAVAYFVALLYLALLEVLGLVFSLRHTIKNYRQNYNITPEQSNIENYYNKAQISNSTEYTDLQFFETLRNCTVTGCSKENLKEQPCQPQENYVLPDSFTQFYILFEIEFCSYFNTYFRRNT